MKGLITATLMCVSILVNCQTILHPGDIVFKAIDSDIDQEKDKISILLLKEISSGTTFQIARAQFNSTTQNWTNQNGSSALSDVQEIVYTGSYNLPINTVICFEVPSNSQGGVDALIQNIHIDEEPSDQFKISNIGAGDNAHLNIEDGVTTSLMITQGDWLHLQIFSKFFGKVIAGFQIGETWDSGLANSSDLPSDISCLGVQGPSRRISTFYCHVECSHGSIDEIRSEFVDFSNWEYHLGGANVDDIYFKCSSTCRISCFGLSLTVFMEGASISASGPATYSDEMRTDLNDNYLLPGQTYQDPLFAPKYNEAGQPYSGLPWLYFGAEGETFDSEGDPNYGSAGYDTEVVDWILVGLRKSIELNSVVCEAAGQLYKDGTIDFVQTLSCCEIDQTIPYYITLEHHNHLIIMTASPVPFVNGTLQYDFTQNQAYTDFFGLAKGQKEVVTTTGNSFYVMYGGNPDQQSSNASATDINVNDKIIWENENNTIAYYHPADLNLSGDINVNDLKLVRINNNTFSGVPR